MARRATRKDGNVPANEEEEEIVEPAAPPQVRAIEQDGALREKRCRLAETRAEVERQLAEARGAGAYRHLANPGARENPAEVRKRADLVEETEALDQAIANIDRHLAEIAPLVEAERVAAEGTRDLEQKAALAALKLELGQGLRTMAERLVGAALPVEIMVGLRAELAAAFAGLSIGLLHAHMLASHPIPPVSADAIEESGRALSQYVDSRRRTLDGRTQALIWPEVVVWASSAFEYKLERSALASCSGRRVPGGSVALIEREAARRARVAGVAEILGPPDGRILAEIVRDALEERDTLDRPLRRGMLCTLSEDVGLRLLENGTALRRTELLPQEIAAFRNGRPESVGDPFRCRDLGVIGGEPGPPPMTATA